MIKENIPTECTIEFSTSLVEEDLQQGIRESYPDELLELKIIKTSENSYRFKEGTNTVKNLTSFISFEFLKMICLEEFDFKLLSFKITQEQEEKSFSNIVEVMAQTKKHNDFYDKFLEVWERFFNKKPEKKPSYEKSSTIDSNRVKYLFEGYNTQIGLLFNHSNFNLDEVNEYLSKLEPEIKVSLIDQDKYFIIYDETSTCTKGLYSFKYNKIVRMIFENLFGFKFRSIFYVPEGKQRKKWITEHLESLIEKNDENYRKFINFVKENYHEDSSLELIETKVQEVNIETEKEITTTFEQEEKKVLDLSTHLEILNLDYIREKIEEFERNSGKHPQFLILPNFDSIFETETIYKPRKLL